MEEKNCYENLMRREIVTLDAPMARETAEAWTVLTSSEIQIRHCFNRNAADKDFSGVLAVVS